MLSTANLSTWSHDGFLDLQLSNPLSDTKTTMDTQDNFRDYHNHSELAELKPLEPLNYLSESSDLSLSSHDAFNHEISSTLGSQLYSPNAMITNPFLGTGGTPEPASSSHSPVSSSNILVKQEDADTFGDAGNLDAIEIDCTTDWSAASQPISLSDQLEPLTESSINHLNLDDWQSMFDLNKTSTDLSDLCINGTMPADLTSIEIQSPQSSTLLASSEFLNTHNTINSQHNTQHFNASSLQALLAAGSINSSNNNYIHSFPVSQDSYQKSQPILYNKLMGSQKTDPLFSRNSSYYQTKDLLSHSTDSTTFMVSTTDDGLGSRLDSRYFDYTQLSSPDSELSSTQLGFDLGDYKGKNRNKLNKSSKLPTIRTEGTKEKPVHHCSVCNRGFLNKSNIKVHLRTHTGEKPFNCEICNKTFRQKAHLLKHHQIHKRGIY